MAIAMGHDVANDSLVILATGGTGGHVFPAEALASALRARGHRLALVTDPRGTAFDGALDDVPSYRVAGAGIAGRSVIRMASSLARMALGLMQALRLFGRLGPALAVGFGSYASVAPLLAARLRGIPIVIHEGNAVLGRANRLLARHADAIAVAFGDTQAVPKKCIARVVRTGQPIRDAIVARRDIPYPELFAGQRLSLLVTGGSQGAAVMARVVPSALAALPSDLRNRIRVIQQCADVDQAKVREIYHTAGIESHLDAFITDMPGYLAVAHLVIARSGASTVSELAVVGRPGILIPYPYATDDHQASNAESFANAGGGWWMREGAFTPERLTETLTDLLNNPDKLAQAASCSKKFGIENAAERLADVADDVIARRSAGRRVTEPLA